MTNEQILKELLANNYSDKIIRIRAKYDGTDDGFNERLLDIYNKLKNDFRCKHFERLNYLYEFLDNAEYENNVDKIKSLSSQIEHHEKRYNDPFLIQLREQIETYINGLKIIPIKTVDKTKEVEVSNSVYQHQDYFKGNSFEIWQKMYEDFKIDNPKESVDLDFMYAIMKNKGLIHKTIGLIDMQTWINKNYSIDLSKLRFTDINQKSNKNRLIIFESITE